MYEAQSFYPQMSNDAEESFRFDSLNVGIFVENYFPQLHFMVRLDINYADMVIREIDNSTEVYNSILYVDEYQQAQKQKFINFNPGIGTIARWKNFTFNFGVYVPLTYLPKGKITRDILHSTNGAVSSRTHCEGTYKGTIGFGIGSFAGVEATILKHFSFGIDLHYHITYLKRELDWYGETNYYSPSAYMTYTDETYTEENITTSRIIPSIVIAYRFDIKKD